MRSKDIGQDARPRCIVQDVSYAKMLLSSSQNKRSALRPKYTAVEYRNNGSSVTNKKTQNIYYTEMYSMATWW